MMKQKIQFATVENNGVVVQIGKSWIFQPKTEFRGGEIKWFDDTKLIRKQEIVDEKK